MPSIPVADCFRTIAECRGDIAWIVDCGSGALTYLSPAAAQVLGYHASDFNAQLASGGDGPLALLCSGLGERLRRFGAGDDSRRQVLREFEIIHGSDGRNLPIDVASTLLVDGGGAALALAGTIRDLSARREHEAGQRRFASMLNHEFRTPLSSIDGAIQRLEASASGVDAATMQRYRRIGAAVDQLSAMLDEYLSPDRLAATGHKHKEHTAQPRHLLDEAAALVRAAGRVATVEAAGLPAQIRCAPDGLRLALRVLVDNALHYSPQAAPIALSGRLEAGGIALLVRDLGSGVPEGELAHIFGKFARGSNAGSRPGSGLGLYMARSVVEVHGGSLTADNHPDGGAVFSLWLPHRDFAGKRVAPRRGNSDNPRD